MEKSKSASNSMIGSKDIPQNKSMIKAKVPAKRETKKVTKLSKVDPINEEEKSKHLIVKRNGSDKYKGSVLPKVHKAKIEVYSD